VVRNRVSFVSLKCEALPEFYFLSIRYLEMKFDNKESRTGIRLAEWVVTYFIVSSWYSVGGVRKINKTRLRCWDNTEVAFGQIGYECGR
jgi:hypothetical protein